VKRGKKLRVRIIVNLLFNWLIKNALSRVSIRLMIFASIVFTENTDCMLAERAESSEMIFEDWVLKSTTQSNTENPTKTTASGILGTIIFLRDTRMK